MKFKNLLQQANYSLVIPNERLMPLSLIIRKEQNIFSFYKNSEGSSINAELKDLFLIKGRGIKYPDVIIGKLPSHISGIDILESDGHFFSKIKSNESFSAKAQFEKAKNIIFDFREAEEYAVNQIMLDEYLQFAPLNVKSPTFIDQLNAGNIFVVISSLVSKKIIFKNADDVNFSGNLQADAAEEYLSINAGGSASNTKDYIIKNQNNLSLIFAIKTARIIKRKGKFHILPENINVRSEQKLNINVNEGFSEIIIE
jgi:hypothetical protein